MTNPSSSSPIPDPAPDADGKSSTFIGDDVLEKSRDPFSKQVQVEQADGSRKGFRPARLSNIQPSPSQVGNVEPVVSAPQKPAPFARLGATQDQPSKADLAFKKLEIHEPAESIDSSFSKIREIQPEDIRIKENSGFRKSSSSSPSNEQKHLFRKSTQTDAEPKIETVVAKKTFQAQLETPDLPKKIAIKKRQEIFDPEFEGPIVYEKTPLTKREKLFVAISLCLVLILCTAAYWKLNRFYYKPIPYPEIASMPVSANGSKIDSYETFWSKPSADQNVKINTTVIPHVVLKTSQANCAYRVFFYDSDGKIMGDPVTLASSNGTLDFSCTSGFSTRQIFFGYQTGSFRPWKFEVWQAKDVNSSSESYQKVFQAQISTLFHE